SRRNPSRPIRCSRVPVAAHSRATFPVFGGISGSHSATCSTRLLRFCGPDVLYRVGRHRSVKMTGPGGERAFRSGVHRLTIGCGGVPRSDAWPTRSPPPRPRGGSTRSPSPCPPPAGRPPPRPGRACASPAGPTRPAAPWGWAIFGAAAVVGLLLAADRLVVGVLHVVWAGLRGLWKTAVWGNERVAVGSEKALAGLGVAAKLARRGAAGLKVALPPRKPA